MEVEVGTLLLSNNKNNVIAKNVLSHLLCLSSKFEVQIARFRTMMNCFGTMMMVNFGTKQ